MLLKLLFALLVDEHPPHTAEKTVHALDAFRVPRLHHLERPHEHLVQAECVRAKLDENVVRIDGIAARLGHLLAVLAKDQSLVDEFVKRLGRRHLAKVEQHLVPKARVQQMQHRVLRSANIQIDPRCGIVASRTHPVALRFVADKAVVVLRVEIAQIVPATAGPLRHGVGLSLLAVTGLAPFLGAGQGRVAGAGRLEIGEIRRREWQVAFAQAKVAALIPNDRKRLAPVALPAEQPVAQLVIHRPMAKRLLLEPSGDLGLGLGGRQAVEKTGVHRRTVAGEAKRLPSSRCLHDDLDRQLEFLRKLQVARVVRRHRHDRAGAVAGQDIVRRPDRHLPAVDRVDRVRAGEDSAFVLGQVGALEVALLRRLGLVRPDFGLVFRGNNLLEQLALRRHDHVRRAEQRVRSRGENGNLDVGILDAEKHLSPLRAADPVALHFLE